MEDKIWCSNVVMAAGTVTEALVFSHQCHGADFYSGQMEVKRKSGFVDRIPLVVPEELRQVIEGAPGKRIRICGQFQSYNHWEGGKSHLSLYVRVREAEEKEDAVFWNEAVFEGCLCRKPVYRKTPLGKEITDLLLAVNRSYGKSDYIPCICWGRNSREASRYSVGDAVRIRGRIQSREYVKWLADDKTENRIAYEISASMFESGTGNRLKDK